MTFWRPKKGFGRLSFERYDAGSTNQKRMKQGERSRSNSPLINWEGLSAASEGLTETAEPLALTPVDASVESCSSNATRRVWGSSVPTSENTTDV